MPPKPTPKHPTDSRTNTGASQRRQPSRMINSDKPGHRPPRHYMTHGGRPAGSKNKLPKELREVFLQALLEVGGVDYVTAFAKQYRVEFMMLLGKMLPREIIGAFPGQTLRIAIPPPPPPGKEDTFG